MSIADRARPIPAICRPLPRPARRGDGHPVLPASGIANREPRHEDQGMRTRITDLLEIEHPIIQGGMHFVGFAELAAAVSAAGGLGIITGLTQRTPEALANEIRRCREMTNRPFGVNLTFLPAVTPPDYRGYIRAIVEGGVKIVETAGNNPQKWLPALKEAGIKVIHKCTSVRHSLEADGMNMGTRFIATKEAPVHEHVKQALLAATELDTRLVMRPLRNTERVLRNAAVDRLLEKERALGPNIKFEDILGEVGGVYPRIMKDGEMDAGAWSCGMVAGLIHDIPTVKELIDRTITEAESIVAGRLKGFMKA